MRTTTKRASARFVKQVKNFQLLFFGAFVVYILVELFANRRAPHKDVLSVSNFAPIERARNVEADGKWALVIGVFLRAEDIDARKVLRETLFRFVEVYDGSNGLLASVLIRFVLGRAKDAEWNRTITREQDAFKDVVVLDVEESMDDGKTYAWFCYVAEKYLYARFAMKADSDSFINVPGLLKFVGELPQNGSYYIGSRRDCMDDIKLCPVKDLVPHKFQYMVGHGYVLSADLVTWIRHSLVPSEFKSGFEDQMVGFWLSKGNVPHSLIKLDLMREVEDLRLDEISSAMVIHRLKSPRMLAEVYSWYVPSLKSRCPEREGIDIVKGQNPMQESCVKW
eukprot:CAMPEP_0184675116 /NCGR_PEP_ID=MMETSP0308-20130426/87613_1 /TAXON_ID=38269 /ORGANISM="Gloeochaete witrockiana, Strain SAG 46.84" /LENGTH=336 /DNA_ID=CAMNT_0027122791 /DNA_START=1355 /DNA_END=2362 /DNA_ORIENTATION=+